MPGLDDTIYEPTNEEWANFYTWCKAQDDQDLDDARYWSAIGPEQFGLDQAEFESRYHEQFQYNLE